MQKALISDLGEWAEDKFSSLCSEAGITRNKSMQDRTGWDYLVEFLPVISKNIPADLKPIEMSARVQVKSKRTGAASVKLKLSNALRFAKEPSPCFVVLFLATNGGHPVRVFAKHFWDNEMVQALRRGREAHVNEREDLNNLTVTLSFGATDDHTDDLMTWMAATIAMFGERYAETKGQKERILGYEGGAIHGSIRLNVSDLGALVDHQIGLTPSAPPLEITLKHRRFGIDLPMPIVEGTPVLAQMHSHPQDCRLRVRGLVGEDLWLPGNLYLPSLPGLPADLRKVRVVAGHCEILLSQTSGGRVTIRQDGSMQRSVPDLRALSRLLAMTHDGPVQFLVVADVLPAHPFAATLPPSLSRENLEQFSNIISCLEKASHGHLPSDLTISLAEIDAAWNDIHAFNGLVTGTDFKGKFEMDRLWPSDLGPVSSLFLYGYVDIGQWTFMAVVRRPITKFEIGGNVATLECGDPRVVEAIVKNGHGNEYTPDLIGLYHQECQMEGNGVLEFYDGDYRAMVNGAKESPVRLHAPLGR